MPEIPLWNRAGQVVASCKVDDDDYERIAARHWHRGDGYARTANGIESAVSMHRMIMGLEPGDGLEIDHINHDRLDNRRANLRVVTHAENMANKTSARGSSSRYAGVSWLKKDCKWRARVQREGTSYDLGYFTDEDAAGDAVSQWQAKHRNM